MDILHNFDELLKAVPAYNPDLIVISGDLCFMKGDEAVYRLIKSKIETLGVPYRIISGNHDDPALIAEVFQLKNSYREGTIFYEEYFKEKPFLFLDSTVGELSLFQQNWLKARLDQMNGDVVLFIHHPPIESGVPFMDQNHLLKNRDSVLEILTAYTGNIYVFSGHYHVDKTIAYKNIVVHITPSCFMQINQWLETFQVDHYRVGFREIDLREDRLLSTVRYL